MTSIAFLGGARKIGNSAIGVKVNGGIILLDYGASPEHNKAPELPMWVEPSEIIGIIVTHAHIDHSGAVPWLYTTAFKPPIISTPLTLELTDLLIRDMIKLSGKYLPFGLPELQRMMSSAIPLKYNASIQLRDNCIATLLNAGHIPGSASVLLEINGKKIWYTGDINLTEAWLTSPATIVKDADIVIIETTYSYKDHPDRKNEERKLVKVAKEIVESKGVVLIPAFSVGRSQEVLITLLAHGFNGKVVLDGMSQKATNIILSYPELISNWYALKKAAEKAKWMKTKSERKKFIKKPSTIIAPAGMLLGGWSKWYLEKLFDNERNAILFVSYQVPGTLGYKVLNERMIQYDGKSIPVTAKVDYFDLSSHAGKSQLKYILSQLEDPEKVFLVHGEEKYMLEFAEEIKDELGLDVVAPSQGETYRI